MAQDTEQYDIFEEFDEIESSYDNDSLEKIEGLTRKQKDVIKMCEYYSDSRYLEANYGNRLGGSGRPVPFRNIVNYRVTLAKVATDLDIKDFLITSDNPAHQVHTMLLNREAYEWMKTSGFAKTLNEMGTTRPKYGGYLIKKNEAKGKLTVDVVRWTNVMTDQNDILGGAIIEKHAFSPVKLNKKADAWDNVKEVLMAYDEVKEAGRDSTITVYEITGEFPICVYKDAQKEAETEEDEYIYSLQRYFLADLDGKKYLMYSEELPGEMTDYYEYLTWEDNGYGLGRGVIEDSEEAQVWTNDAVVNESIAMALAGRVGIATNSKKLGNNVLEHDHGKIYELEDGKQMTSVNFAPAALGQYANIIDAWKRQADNVASSFDAATGEQPPSGTPLGTTQLLNAVATKPFDYKREEWGIHLTKVFENWIIPHLIKKLKKEHILVSEFTDMELEMIDESFAALNTNDILVEDTIKALEDQLAGRDTPLPTEEDKNAQMEKFKSKIRKTGKKRYIEIPDNYFDGVIPKVTVLITGEQKNKAVILQSLSEIMRFVTSTFNPNTGEFGALTDPTLSRLFNQMVELAGAGVSPISIGAGMGRKATTPAPTPATPVPTAPITEAVPVA